jgi:hypothetical protein
MRSASLLSKVDSLKDSDSSDLGVHLLRGLIANTKDGHLQSLSENF